MGRWRRLHIKMVRRYSTVKEKRPRATAVEQ
jgi:hypothetical protein